MSTRTLQEQIDRATTRLAQLKAREIIKTRQSEARERQKARREDSHRKIKLGGLVIASGVDHFDPAALVGILLTHRDIPAEAQDIFREKGLRHLAEREAARGRS